MKLGNKTAREINVQPLDDKAMAIKYQKRVRHGKTANDRGAPANSLSNRQQRNAYTQWCSDSSSAATSTATASLKFPWGACNGKRTRALRARHGKRT